MLHIPPNQVWDMSLKEVTLAIKGFREYNGGDTEEPVTRDDMEKLKELYPDY